jgi:thiosulfate reductase cytochrome b subunit
MSEALYLYPVWLRLWHWINALLFLTLIVTGVSMHYSDAGWLLPFETAMPVHNASGILLTLSWIGFVIGNLKTGNGRHYRFYWKTLPRDSGSRAAITPTASSSMSHIRFMSAADAKLNALQTLSYLGAMYALMPLLILSGWGFLLSHCYPRPCSASAASGSWRCCTWPAVGSWPSFCWCICTSSPPERRC